MNAFLGNRDSCSMRLTQLLLLPFFGVLHIGYKNKKLFKPDQNSDHKQSNWYARRFHVIYITISTIMSVCPLILPLSACPSQFFFSLKLPWNHPLTPGVDPSGSFGAHSPFRGAINGRGFLLKILLVYPPRSCPSLF